MSIGILAGDHNFAFSALSVITKGVLSAETDVTLTKSDYIDITEFDVVFTPTGRRNVQLEELRPSFTQDDNEIVISQPANGSPHEYMVLGR